MINRCSNNMDVVMILMCILGLVWVSGCYGAESCRKGGIYGAITPTNLSYVYFGDVFTMTCAVTNYSSNIGNGRVIMRGPNGENQMKSESSEPLQTTIRDVINATYQNGQNWAHYVCLYKNKTSECQLANLYIRVDHRPRLPRDGRCVVNNWSSMKCTWDLEVTYRKVVNVSIQYEQLNGTLRYSLDTQSWYHCPQKQQDGNKLTCNFNRVDLGTYFFVLKIWNLRDRTSNMQDLIQTNLTVVTDNIVKPAKVVGLSGEANSTNIKLRWSHDKSSHRMLFRIRYHSRWDNVTSWKETNTTKYEIVLKDLKPHTQYYLRVSCIPLRENKAVGYWSDVATRDIETSEDVPGAVPTVYPGFFSCITENCTRVVFYWQHIEDEDKNGEIQNYRITIATKISELADAKNVTKYDKIGRNNYSYEVVMDSDRFASVGFSQATRVGYPQDDKILDLAPFYQRPPTPDFVKVEVLKQTKVKVKWKSVPANANKGYYKRLITYTVVWCESAHKTKFICESEIKAYVTLVRDCKTDVCTWDLDLPKSHERYMFGVSTEAESDSGRFRSSGIEWSTCTYSKNSELNPLTAELNQQEDPKSVGISWKHARCGPEPTGFTIFYCEVDDKEECKDKTTFEIPVNTTVTSYMLTGLKEGITYNVWVTGEYENRGVVTKTEAKVYHVPKGVDPEYINTNTVNGGLKPEVIAGICVGVAVLAGVGVFLCIKFRHCIRKVNEETRHIDMPMIKENGGTPRPKSVPTDSYIINSTERTEDEPLLDKLPRPEINSGGSASKSGETDLTKVYYSTTPDQLHSKSDHIYIESSQKRDSGYASPGGANGKLTDENVFDQNSRRCADNASFFTNSSKRNERTRSPVPRSGTSREVSINSSVDQYVKQNSCAVNFESGGKFEHSDQGSEENVLTSDSVRNPAEDDSNSPLGMQVSNVNSANMDSSGSSATNPDTGSIPNSVASYAKATADTCDINLCSSGSDNPYIRHTGNTNSNSGTSVSPYVTQAGLNSMVNVSSLRSSNPYVPHVAISSINHPHSTNPTNLCVPSKTSINNFSNSYVPDVHSGESVVPYVSRMMDSGNTDVNSGETVDTYVQQAMDTSGSNLTSAGSIDSYVQQTLNSGSGAINSAGTVDPYVQQTVDTSASNINSAGSVDTYVQQALDTSASNLNSAVSVDPYVLQTTDSSGNYLNSADSINPYVQHTLDSSAANFNSSESIGPYALQTHDTSAGTINSASFYDPYMQQSENTSGLISNSGAESVNPYPTSSETISNPYVRHSMVETQSPHVESDTAELRARDPGSFGNIMDLEQPEDNSLPGQSDNWISTRSASGLSRIQDYVRNRSDGVLDQENSNFNRTENSSSSDLGSRNPDESVDIESGDCDDIRVLENQENMTDERENTDNVQTVVIPVSQEPSYTSGQNYHQTFQTLSNGYVRPVV